MYAGITPIVQFYLRDDVETCLLSKFQFSQFWQRFPQDRNTRIFLFGTEIEVKSDFARSMSVSVEKR